jgi:hypothetical protein
MTEQDVPALWRVSAFDAQRRAAASSSFADLRRKTVLATTLQAELRLLERRRASSDALEVVATCMRLREPALVYLQCDEGVWPVTLFPDQMVYHSPRNLLRGSARTLGSLEVMEVEPPGVRPPGHWMHERIAHAEAYHPLLPALWTLALQGPRLELLQEISGTAAYRVLRNPAVQHLSTPGALGPAIERLRKQAAPLRTIASWPGMSTERASRLVNALYLSSNLIVSRAHHAAQPGMLRWFFERLGR